MTRTRIENRATSIYSFLRDNMGRGFTLSELCLECDIQNSASTRKAINRARELAKQDGYILPPAIPTNGFLYMVTDSASDAIDPTMHMKRIERGVRNRADEGMEFIRNNLDSVPVEERAVMEMQLAVSDVAKTAVGTIQQTVDDMVSQTIAIRREHRQEEAELRKSA